MGLGRIGLAALVCIAVAPSAGTAQQSIEQLLKFAKSEKVGALRVHMTDAEVKAVLPAPPARSAERYVARGGFYRATWTYAATGLTLAMSAERKGGTQLVEAITCSGRCALKTARGIGIGSSLAEVQQAYAAEFNKAESKLPGSLVAGPKKGAGLAFTLTAGKVTAFVLSADAE
jgi:hypothetical protein